MMRVCRCGRHYGLGVVRYPRDGDRSPPGAPADRPFLPVSVSFSSSPFRLVDLLEAGSLGLELLVGDPSVVDRRVSGVHSVEVGNPARWLAPDWVMLTTGVRLVGDEPAQRDLPRELHDAGVAALGIGVGVEFDVTPEPLLDAARELGFPVFAVPLQTPFREVHGFVERALLSSETRELQRLSSIQRYLIDALYAPRPRAVIVERLSTLLGASVAVLAANGDVEDEVGERPTGVAEALTDPVRGARRLDVDGWRVVATPVAPAPEDPDERWIVVALRGRGGGFGSDRLVRAVLQTAAPLLAGIGRLDDTRRRQDRAVRRELLDDLIHGRGDVPTRTARAAACGIDLGEPTAVVVVAPCVSAGGDLRRPPGERALGDSRGGGDSPGGGAPDATLGRLERSVDARLAAHGVHRLLGVDRGRVVALIRAGGGEVPDALLAQLAADPATAVGAGRIGIGADDVVQSAADAHVAVEHVPAGNGPRWGRAQDVELPALVAGQVELARIAPAVAAVQAAIDSRPGLREALVAYLDHDQDVAAAAAALHLHPNSLRHRLGRLAEALGRSLRDPQTIATLVLTLEIERRGPAPGRPG